MTQHIPHGPWGNPQLDEGLYEALVENIRHVDFGDDNGSMLELTFRLEHSGLSFESRLYLPQTFSTGCQHRLWYLCQALRVEGYDLMENPDVAVGRRLILDVATSHPTTATHGHAYSDVKRFLPYADCEQESEDGTKSISA